MDKIVVSCLESRIDENQSVYSRFLLGPFIGGHAVTVATALRRALLSEVKNIAITALHIQGVTHEFSTVVGIRESVLELSLNFQQIILSTQTKTKNVQVGYLHVQGPAIVHANDLKLPDGIECVNPTQYIATLSSEGLLVVKFLIYDKKSFLKSKTSTLNSKKIKEAKVFSERLSKSLLGHAEYDPSQLYRLLRNQSLPRLHSFAVQGAGQGVVECLLPPTDPHERLRAREADGGQGEVLQARPLEDLQEEGNQLRAAPTQRFASNLRVASERTLTRAKHGLQIEDLQATDSQSGGPGRHGQQRTGLEVPGVANQSRDLTTVGTDSNLDHTASLLSDEFNSEVCLRTIIPLEPIFTPVYQVNFGIERDDLSNQIRERIIMEVWTNGSIHPRQAINEAVLSTMSIFSKLRKTFHLDSHALALSVNSAASLTNRTVPGDGLVSSGFARARRLHKRKSTVKGGQLNDDVSESGRVLACSRPYRPVSAADTVRYSPLRGEPLVRSGSLGFVDKKQELRLATNGSKSDRGLTRDRFTRKFKGQPNFTKLDLTNSVLPKLNSFSSLEFVRSRHPIALFLQSFGKSHIRGQTFLVEQSFGLKARFFKGHRAVLSKAKYTSEDLTFKRTFLPSFKVILGSYRSNFQNAPTIDKANLLNLDRPTAAQDRGRLTKVQLLFRLRFCLSGAILRGTPCAQKLRFCDPNVVRITKPVGFVRKGSLSSTNDPLRLQIFDLQAAAKHEEVAQRSCASPEQEPRNLLSPGCESVANLGRARCTAKRSKRTVSTLRFAANLHFGAGAQPTAVQGRQQIEDLQAQQAKRKPILFLIKYRTFSFTRNALHIFRRQQEASLFLLPLTKQLIRLKMVLVLNSCLPLMSKRAEPSLRFRTTETQAFTTVEGSALFDGKQVLLALARSALGCSSIPCTQSNVGDSDSSATETDSFVLADRRSGCLQTRRVCTQIEDLQAKLCKPANSEVLPAVSKRYRTCLAQQSCAAASGQFDKFIRGGTRVLTLAQSKTEQAPPSPVGKLWLRKNLKKQFGFFQFACHGLRLLTNPTGLLPNEVRLANRRFAPRVLATDSPCGEKRRHGSTISHSFFTDRAFLLTRLQRLTKSETRVAKLGSSGLFSASLSQNDSDTSTERLRALTKPEVLYANRRFAIESPEDELALAPRKRSPAPTASQMLETRASLGPVPPSLTSCSPQLSQTRQKRDTFEFAKSTKLSSPLLSGVVFGAAVHWKKRWMVRLGVCVNRTGPLTNRRFVNGGSNTVLANRAGGRIALSKKSNFTTFPLIMTKVPPLCLPSDLVTLISFPGEEARPGKIDCLTSARYCSTKQSKSKARAVSKPYLGFARSLLLHKAEQDRLHGLHGEASQKRSFCAQAVQGGQQEQSGVYKTVGFVSQRSSSADLFGFNSGGTVLARAPLRLQIEDLQARRSAATPLTNQRFVQVDESSFQLTTQERLSSLYGSNLDKISFLSSDLANLSLSLKTYTFLKKKGKKNMGSLLKCSPNALFSLLNGDEKMFHEIERCFLFLGLPFKERF